MICSGYLPVLGLEACGSSHTAANQGQLLVVQGLGMLSKRLRTPESCLGLPTACKPQMLKELQVEH